MNLLFVLLFVSFSLFASGTYRVSDPNEEFASSLAIAMSSNNEKKLQKILKQYHIRYDAKNRSNSKNKIINEALALSLNKGSSCPLKTIKFIYDEYDARIERLDQLKKKLDCDSRALSGSLRYSKNKEKVLVEIERVLSESIKMKKYSEVQARHLKKMRAQFIKVIFLACKKDKLSKVCKLKARLQELSKIKPSETPKA